MSKELELNIDVGGGWFAYLANVVDLYSPIALITLARGEDRRHVRLDLDKKMFLDSTPDDVEADSSKSVAELVVGQLIQ